MKSHLIAAIAVATTALVPISTVAQEQNRTAGNRSAETRSGTQAGQQQSKMAPQEFVNQAAVSNMFEIQSSRLAQEKARDDRLREFARQMVNDHSSAADQLRQAAQKQEQELALPNQLDEEHRQKLEQLRGMKGKRFDRNYVKMQIEGHEAAVELYRRYDQTGSEGPLRQFAERTLPTLREHQQSIQQIRDERFPNASIASRENAQQDQQSGEGAQIRIQRTPPSVMVDQASPHVTVQQARPTVSVHQAQPEIVVRQPRPTVTIDIPQPQITLRMPDPQVNVAQAEPKVTVQRARPQVQVQRSDEQAQVKVERAEANVDVRRQQASVEVNRAQGQPAVRYEREDPRVVVNRAEGQPEVRIERMTSDQSSARGQGMSRPAASQSADQNETSQQAAQGGTTARSADQSDTSQQAARRGTTAEERDRATQRLASSPEGQTQGSARSNADATPRRSVRVEVIEGMPVYNVRGERVGDVDTVVRNRAGRKYVVVADGGFLGFGEDKVAFPTERFWMRGDRLVIRGVTSDDLDNLADYRDQAATYTDLAENNTIEVRDWR